MKQISLSSGKLALVDDEDYGWLAVHKWSALHVGNNWYAARYDEDHRHLSMHREIHGHLVGDQLIHHINGNGLDNRRCNMRVMLPGAHIELHKHKNYKRYWHHMHCNHCGWMGTCYHSRQICLGCGEKALQKTGLEPCRPRTLRLTAEGEARFRD